MSLDMNPQSFGVERVRESGDTYVLDRLPFTIFLGYLKNRQAGAMQCQ